MFEPEDAQRHSPELGSMNPAYPEEIQHLDSENDDVTRHQGDATDDDLNAEGDGKDKKKKGKKTKEEKEREKREKQEQKELAKIEKDRLKREKKEQEEEKKREKLRQKEEAKRRKEEDDGEGIEEEEAGEAPTPSEPKPSKVKGFFSKMKSSTPKKRPTDSTSALNETENGSPPAPDLNISSASEVKLEIPPEPEVETGDPYKQPRLSYGVSPGGYEINPSDTLTRPMTFGDTMKASVHGMARRPPMVYGKETDGKVLQLQPVKEEGCCKCGNLLTAVLVFGVILGIIFTAMSGVDYTLKVIGPAFIGLSIFALIGKWYFSLAWEVDTHPALKPINDKISTVWTSKTRPYPRQMQPQVQVAQSDTIPMDTIKVTSSPYVYDQEIDLSMQQYPPATGGTTVETSQHTTEFYGGGATSSSIMRTTRTTTKTETRRDRYSEYQAKPQRATPTDGYDDDDDTYRYNRGSAYQKPHNV